MIFNDHSDLAGKHAFLSPSNYHWLGYNDQKLEARFISAMAARKGTELHQFAHDAIRLRIPLPDVQETLNMYVNDGIQFQMRVEQSLYYSPNCFGHSDTISFMEEFLRIHDLKTGISATSEKQLEVYAGIFCLEYMISPFDIGIELRIYQNNEVRIYEPYGEQIQYIMDKIVDFDQQIKSLRGESWL